MSVFYNSLDFTVSLEGKMSSQSHSALRKDLALGLERREISKSIRVSRNFPSFFTCSNPFIIRKQMLDMQVQKNSAESSNCTLCVN